MRDGDGPDTGTAGIAEAADRPAPTDDGAGRTSATGARTSQKEKRLAERGDRILDALATLITRWGYGKTTVDDIAREAGVAKGTVYLHWPTKGAMLHALIEREERQWNEVVLERMAADPRNGTISSTYRHALALARESPCSAPCLPRIATRWASGHARRRAGLALTGVWRRCTP